MGIFEDFVCHDETEPFEAGDALVVYSDGLVEAKGEVDRYGEERLAELVASSKAASADGLVQALFDSVIEFSGGLLTDDVACVAVRMVD